MDFSIFISASSPEARSDTEASFPFFSTSAFEAMSYFSVFPFESFISIEEEVTSIISPLTVLFISSLLTASTPFTVVLSV